MEFMNPDLQAQRVGQQTSPPAMKQQQKETHIWIRIKKQPRRGIAASLQSNKNPKEIQ
jgi:hypothetical protein